MFFENNARTAIDVFVFNFYAKYDDSDVELIDNALNLETACPFLPRSLRYTFVGFHVKERHL